MLARFSSELVKLPRRWKQLILVAFDIVALSLALWLSYTLRLGGWQVPTRLDALAGVLLAPAVALPIFIRMGLYRAVIRFLPERALWTIFKAVTLAALAWTVMAFLTEATIRGVLPRSVPFVYWAFALIFVGGSRFIAKSLLRPHGSMAEAKRVVIYGAGEAGAALAMAYRHTHRDVLVVGLVDDNARLHGHDVAGIRVHSPKQLSALIERYEVAEIILSTPSLGFARRQELLAQTRNHSVKIRTLPPLADVVGGKYLVSQIREIDIDELLGRSSVPPDVALVRQMIEGRTVMVTGAGGSIGSELCRLIARWNPRRLVLFEANEFALYRIDHELSGNNDFELVSVLASVTDGPRVRHTLTSYGVEVVFHAAAHKHVPLVEANALEGIRNNVLGTRTVAELALETGVRNFVLISSDKAVRPTNVMGATKRWSELIVRDKAAEAKRANSGQRFCSVRFGNVLGSNGSVVPLFKEQIAHGGPVTLTDPEMTRYFMSIHEAAELIVQAGALSNGGDVFLLDMGEPIHIKDMAENMIRLAGFSVRGAARPDGDIEVVVTGKRPGEKLFEELFYDRKGAGVTTHPKILRAAHDGESADINVAVGEMRDLLERQDEPAARALLFATITQPTPAADTANAPMAENG